MIFTQWAAKCWCVLTGAACKEVAQWRRISRCSNVKNNKSSEVRKAPRALSMMPGGLRGTRIMESNYQQLRSKLGPASVLTSASDAALEVSDGGLASFWVTGSAGEGCRCLRSAGDIPRGTGEAEGVGPGEGLGERVPMTTAWSSEQDRPLVRRNSSVSLSTTSSLVRCVTSRIRFTTCGKGGREESLHRSVSAQ